MGDTPILAHVYDSHRRGPRPIFRGLLMLAAAFRSLPPTLLLSSSLASRVMRGNSAPQRAPVSVIMDTSLAELVEDWHDFDVLVGTAAATLVGLMFVAASIGASVFTEKDRAALKAFISPTVVHFTTVLVIAVVALVPTHEWHTLASLLAVVGVAGAVYSVNVWIELFIHRRFNVDVVDRLF